MNKKNHNKYHIGLTIKILILIIFSGLILSYGIDFSMKKKYYLVMLTLRFNQLLGSLFVGGGLATCGLILQSYFNNKLASPQTLGIINMSGVGAALSIALGFNSFWQIGFSLIGALIIFLVIPLFKMPQNGVIFLGIFLNFLGDSIIMWIKALFANAEDYVTIDYWFWGSLNKVTNFNRFYFIIIIIAVIILIYKSSFLDLLSQGVDHVKNITINEKTYKFNEKIILLMIGLIITIATLTTGKIGFIGLIAPHLTKKIYNGMSHNKMIILTFLTGSCILTIALFTQILLEKLMFGTFLIGLIISIPGVIIIPFILINIRGGKNV